MTYQRPLNAGGFVPPNASFVIRCVFVVLFFFVHCFAATCLLGGFNAPCKIIEPCAETNAASGGTGVEVCYHSVHGAGGVWYHDPVKALLARVSHLQYSTEPSLNKASTYILVCIYAMIPSRFVLIYERAVHQLSQDTCITSYHLLV